jgi:hypothetical protein
LRPTRDAATLTATAARLAEAAGCRFLHSHQIDIHRFYTAGRRFHRARTKVFLRSCRTIRGNFQAVIGF